MDDKCKRKLNEVEKHIKKELKNILSLIDYDFKETSSINQNFDKSLLLFYLVKESLKELTMYLTQEELKYKKLSDKQYENICLFPTWRRD